MDEVYLEEILGIDGTTLLALKSYQIHAFFILCSVFAGSKLDCGDLDVTR